MNHDASLFDLPLAIESTVWRAQGITLQRRPDWTTWLAILAPLLLFMLAVVLPGLLVSFFESSGPPQHALATLAFAAFMVTAVGLPVVLPPLFPHDRVRIDGEALHASGLRLPWSSVHSTEIRRMYAISEDGELSSVAQDYLVLVTEDDGAYALAGGHPDLATLRLLCQAQLRRGDVTDVPSTLHTARKSIRT